MLAQTQSSSPAAASQSTTATNTNKAEEATQLVKQGQKLAEQGKSDEAFALYQRALEIDPELYLAQLYTGVALDLQGKYTEARTHLQKAIELASEDQTVQALRVMAVSYAFEKNTDKASELERRAFDLQYNWKKYVDAAGTADELARIYLESGDFDNAFQWYQTGHLTAMKIPNLAPAQKDLWTFRWEAALARIAARRGQHDQALQHLAACKAIIDKANNPDQAPFYPYIAGYVALYGGDYRTAIDNLQKSNQKDPFVLLLLAQSYEKSGNAARAMEYYRQIVGMNLHNPSNAFARPIAMQKTSTAATPAS